MRYSDEIIEEVRSRSDIVDVVSQYVKLQRKGAYYFGLCPFHNEKSPSFSVTPSRQMYHCFGCGASGNVFTFLMEYENMTFVEALSSLADRAGVTLPQMEPSGKARDTAKRRDTLLKLQKEAASWFYYNLRRENGQKALQYLKERGLSEETMQKFGLGYAGKSGNLYPFLKEKGYSDELLRQSGLFQADERRGMYDKFWNRVIFPIMDGNSRVIGFGGRVLGEGKPKYLNSPETEIFDKSRTLYGLNIARTSRQKQILVCEGYMDVIALHQAGFTNAVASLGTSLTSGQAGLLRRYTEEVLLLYDSDEAGVRAAIRGIPILRSVGLHAKVVDLSPCKDPDEFIRKQGADAFRQRLGEAMNGFLFTVQARERSYDLTDPQSKTDFFRDIANRLLEFDEELERNNYIEAIASRYGIRREELQKMVSQMAMKGIITGESPPRKSGSQTPSRDQALEEAQSLVLTCLVNDPALLPAVRHWLSERDFVTPLCAETAKLIFAQAEEGDINPARLLNQFEDTDKQSQVAALFHTSLHLEQSDKMQKAFADALVVMKTAALDQQMEDAGSIEEMQNLIIEKNQLSKLHAQVMDLNLSFEEA